MKKSVIVVTLLVALVAYRVYIVMNRYIPSNIVQPNVVRMLDEIGRIAKYFMTLCIMLDINPASQPIKFVVNNGFGLIMNGIYRQNADIQVTNTKIANVPVRIIQPLKQKTLLPAIIYIHGGGWTWFNTDTYLSYLENLANRTQMVVIAVEYRKAPEHTFPDGFSDCIDVTRHILTRNSGVDINNEKVLVAGDGAGGNLAAAVARFFPRKIMIQILIDPILQFLDFNTPSYQDNANVLAGISSPEMEIFHWLLYIGQPMSFMSKVKDNKHVFPGTVQSHWNLIDSARHLPNYLELTTRKTSTPRDNDFIVASRLQNYVTNDTLSSMMCRNLKDIPNAYVITSHYDVLRDEAVMYTTRMHDDGTRVKLKHYKDAFHGFFLFSHESSMFKLNIGKFALQEMVDFMNAMVHKHSVPLEEMYRV